MLIARGLISLRARANLTQTQLAKEAGCGKAMVGRYEDWKDRSRVKWATVKGMAEACKASPEERDALVALAKIQGEGWWVDRGVPELLDPLLSFESAGDHEHVFASGLVPGLLQTRAYAQALHEAQMVRASREEVDRHVEIRMMRQQALNRDDFALWVVLDEAVFKRVIGNRAVMAEQLAHLEEAQRQKQIDIQVLPFASGAHAAGAGAPFVTIGREDAANPLASMSVVYLETHDRGIYLDNPQDIAKYKMIFDYLRSQAVDRDVSTEMLAAARQDYAS
ncbi:helix-turn-helix domain-containing protein [Streptomyces daliensis]|uniref:Helix-turn-helix domain-containing protein n=1 Tax=Streptomyces daliensis TaxID=299421 RepID=A0A8T4IMR2_9ACTN|nr:helix-turn-helix domain-containing protein [Streptomyces daliensis]